MRLAARMLLDPEERQAPTLSWFRRIPALHANSYFYTYLGVTPNRGEGRHSLARAIFHGQRGELRQRYREGQEDQLGVLGLVREDKDSQETGHFDCSRWIVSKRASHPQFSEPQIGCEYMFSGVFFLVCGHLSVWSSQFCARMATKNA